MRRAEAGGTVSCLPASKAMMLLLDRLRKNLPNLCAMSYDYKACNYEPATEREFLCLVSDVVRGGDPRHLPSIPHVVLPLHCLTDLLPHGKIIHA